MYVTYSGPTPVRRIHLPDGRDIRVKRGEAVEVPDPVGALLTQQKYFTEATPPQDQETDKGEAEDPQGPGTDTEATPPQGPEPKPTRRRGGK